MSKKKSAKNNHAEHALLQDDDTDTGANGAAATQAPVTTAAPASATQADSAAASSSAPAPTANAQKLEENTSALAARTAVAKRDPVACNTVASSSQHQAHTVQTRSTQFMLIHDFGEDAKRIELSVHVFNEKTNKPVWNSTMRQITQHAWTSVRSWGIQADHRFQFSIKTTHSIVYIIKIGYQVQESNVQQRSIITNHSMQFAYKAFFDDIKFASKLKAQFVTNVILCVQALYALPNDAKSRISLFKDFLNFIGPQCHFSATTFQHYVAEILYPVIHNNHGYSMAGEGLVMNLALVAFVVRSTKTGHARVEELLIDAKTAASVLKLISTHQDFISVISAFRNDVFANVFDLVMQCVKLLVRSDAVHGGTAWHGLVGQFCEMVDPKLTCIGNNLLPSTSVTNNQSSGAGSKPSSVQEKALDEEQIFLLRFKIQLDSLKEELVKIVELFEQNPKVLKLGEFFEILVQKLAGGMPKLRDLVSLRSAWASVRRLQKMEEVDQRMAQVIHHKTSKAAQNLVETFTNTVPQQAQQKALHELVVDPVLFPQNSGRSIVIKLSPKSRSGQDTSFLVAILKALSETGLEEQELYDAYFQLVRDELARAHSAKMKQVINLLTLIIQPAGSNVAKGLASFLDRIWQHCWTSSEFFNSEFLAVTANGLASSDPVIVNSVTNFLIKKIESMEISDIGECMKNIRNVTGMGSSGQSFGYGFGSQQIYCNSALAESLIGAILRRMPHHENQQVVQERMLSKVSVDHPWYLLLSASGSHLSFLLTPYLQELIIPAGADLFQKIMSRELSFKFVKHLKELGRRERHFVRFVLMCAKRTTTGSTPEQDLTNAIRDVIRIEDDVQSQLKKMDRFLSGPFCKGMSEVESLIAELQTITKSMPDTSVRNLIFPQLLKDNIENIDSVSSFSDSIVFKNLYKAVTASTSEQVSLADVFKRCQSTLLEMAKMGEEFMDKSLSLEDMNRLFNGIQVGHVDAELDKLKQACKRPRGMPTKCIRELRAFADLKNTQKRCAALHMLWQQHSDFVVKDEQPNKFTVLGEFLGHVSASSEMRKIVSSLDAVSTILSRFTEQAIDVCVTLVESADLLKFLRSHDESDFPKLIDAVEELGDSIIRVNTIRDMIEVAKFLRPLTQIRPNTSSDMFFDCLVDMLSRATNTTAVLISGCNANIHGIESIMRGLTNRAEVTKERIRSIAQHGVFRITPQISNTGHHCHLVSAFLHDKEFSFAELQELRSRALLIANADNAAGTSVTQTSSDGDAIDDPDMTPDSCNPFGNFIKQVNYSESIAAVLDSLILAGFPFEDSQITLGNSITKMFSFMESTQNKLQDWHTSLESMYNRYYFLTFFSSQQFWKLESLFVNPQGTQLDQNKLAVKAALDLIQFVDPTARVKLTSTTGVRYQVQVPADPQERLQLLARTLDILFAQSASRFYDRTNLESSVISEIRRSFDGYASAGDVLVVSADERRIYNVVLGLYAINTESIPAPYEVFLCSASTQAQELKAFLLRSFLFASACGDNTNGVDPLFSIVSVENLSFELQGQLLELLRTCQQECESKGRRQPRLALVFSSSRHSQMSHQYRDSCKKWNGLSDKLMKIVMAQCQRAVIVTSPVPGSGKTEWVRQTALASRRCALSIPISGEMSLEDIIQRFNTRKFKDISDVHLDIGSLGSDRSGVNHTLFSLLVFRCIRARDNIFFLNKDATVYIEIANTWDNDLLGQISLASALETVELQPDLSRVIVPSVVNTSIQIVCNYLSHLQNGSLDSTDLDFEQNRGVRRLSEAECRSLLDLYFFQPYRQQTNEAPSFSALATFTSVLSDQLLSMSSSAFFSVSMLKDMGTDPHVRTHLFESLLETSRLFTQRSVNRARSQQRQNLLAIHSKDSVVTDEDTISRLAHMVTWENSNHSMVLFHNDRMSICTVYRTTPPRTFRSLYQSQRSSIPNISLYSHTQLLDELKTVVGARHTQVSSASYVITPDNFMKMLLILLRIRAFVPVIISGETGCGKTSLIHFLATIVGAQFQCMNIHAGISAQMIIEAVQRVRDLAENIESEVWMFLDEINTCDSLGLIQELVCSHSLLGIRLPNNLRILAACNPYRLKKETVDGASVSTVGLKKQTQSHSRLVYRVHPLPESMIDFIWDFGSIPDGEEVKYIQCMLNGCPYLDRAVAAVSYSQRFVRQVEDGAAVSLRDIRRFSLLQKFFFETLTSRMRQQQQRQQQNIRKGFYYLYDTWISPRTRQLQQRNLQSEDIQLSSIILALCHCYHCRLGTNALRSQYRKQIARLLGLSETVLRKILADEQEDWLRRMELPEGTALNTALKENVFVILVSILNKIPVFLVGNPGSSKTLATQLIAANLRGSDSSDQFFKTLPRIQMITYQGSESSTSEGIIHVFQRAEKLLEGTTATALLPVVLIDEIGLAEISKANPLKALHSLLEVEAPSVAFVGISNWRLDAAKMNRGIFLARTEPDPDDLQLTAKAIQESFTINVDVSNENFLSAIASAYHSFVKQQQSGFSPNFHGLRDFYALIKRISRAKLHVESQGNYWTTDDQLRSLFRSLERNFSGLETSVDILWAFFCENYTASARIPDVSHEPVLNLVNENLNDHDSRHLLIVSEGESALWILDNQLRLTSRQPEIMYGSLFEDDQNKDEYSYRVLSHIIACMETGRTLVLLNLDGIYGALYDLLNQRYTLVHRKKNCRIALGANSNPMCFVHDDFRCLVLVNDKVIREQDPPFLNRFEKQFVQFKDVLDDGLNGVVDHLYHWIESLTTVPGGAAVQPLQELIPAWSSEYLPSLVAFHHSRLGNDDLEQITARCQTDIIQVASIDMVLRSSVSRLAAMGQQGLESFQHAYFSQNHESLFGYISHALSADSVPKPMRSVVYTFTSVLSQVKELIQEKGLHIQTLRIGTLKSERDLNSALNSFFSVPGEGLLFIQFDAAHDKKHASLTKFVIDRLSAEHNSTDNSLKHICMLVHCMRGNAHDSRNTQCFLSPLSGWTQVTIDRLEGWNGIVFDELLKFSTKDLLLGKYPGISLPQIVKESITGAIMSVVYGDGIEQRETYIQQFIRCMSTDDQLIEFLYDQSLALMNVDQMQEMDWRVILCCDKQFVLLQDDIISSLRSYLGSLIIPHLRSIIVYSEKYSASQCLFLYNQDVRDKWCECIKTDLAKITNHLVVTAKVTPIDGICYPFFCNDLEKMSSVMKDSFVRLMGQCSSAGSEDQTEQGDNEHAVVPDVVIEHCRNLYSKACSQFQSDDLRRLFVRSQIVMAAHDIGLDRDLLEWIVRHFLDVDTCDPVPLQLFFWKHHRELISLCEILQSCDKFISKKDLVERPLFDTYSPTWTQDSWMGFKQQFIDIIIDRINPQIHSALIQSKEGIKKWLEVAMAVQMRTYDLECNPERMSWLKLWRDFAQFDIMSIEDKDIESSGLLRRVARVDHTESDLLDDDSDGVDTSPFSESVVTLVLNHLEKLEESNSHQKIDCDSTLSRILQLKSRYLGRCLDMDVPECELVCIQQLAKSTALCQFSRPILDHLLDKVYPSGSIENMDELLDLCSQESEIVRLLEDALQQMGKDSALATAICDALTSKASQFMDERDDGSASGISNTLLEFLEPFKRAAQQLQVADSSRFPILSTVVGCAIVKIYLTNYSANCISMATDDPAAALDTQVQSTLDTYLGAEDRHEMRFFVLKQLRNLKIPDVLTFPFQDIGAKWAEQMQLVTPASRFALDPFLVTSPEHYDKAKRAVLQLIEFNDSSLLEAALTQCQNDGNMRLAVLNSLAFHGYLECRSIGQNPPSNLRQWILAHKNEGILVQAFGIEGKNVIVNYLLNFDSPNVAHNSVLRLSRDTLDQQLQEVAVMIHATNMILAQGQAQGTWPLSVLARANTATVGQQFIVCMEENELGAIRRAIGPTSMYSCACGYRYFIANCGRPDEISTCPSCRAQVGGQGHNLIQGQRIDPENTSGENMAAQKGYITKRTVEIPSHYHVRELTIPSFRLLHLLLHAPLFVLSCSNPAYANTIAQNIQRPITQVQQYTFDHSQVTWDILLNRLQCNSAADLAAFMHVIISRLHIIAQSSPANVFVQLASEEQRLQWEQMFITAVSELPLQNVQATIAQYQQEITKRAQEIGVAVDFVTQLIEETVDIQGKDLDTMTGLRYAPLLRTVRSYSFEGLRKQFLASQYSKNKHPFLVLFFEQYERLEKLHHLYPIIKWTNFVTSRANYVVKRQTAREMTIREFINSLPLPSDDAKKSVEQMFQAFSDAWSAVAKDSTQVDCKMLPVREQITLDDELALCLPDDKDADAGIYMIAAMMHLCQEQNAFLEEARQIAKNHDALRFLHAGNTTFKRPIQQVQEHEVVAFSIDNSAVKNMQQYAWCELAYGKGKQISYDYASIELELALELLLGKKTLVSSLESINKVQYQSELLRERMDMLSTLNKYMQQEHVLPLQSQKDLGLVLQDSKVAFRSDIIAQLESLMWFLVNVHGENRDRSIKDLCNRWSESLRSTDSLKRTHQIGELPAKYIVPLYEFLEEQMFSVWEQMLQDQFKVPIHDGIIAQVTEFLNNEAEQFHAPVLEFDLETALRRLISRCLVFTHVDPQLELQYYLGVASFWPRLQAPENIEDRFPTDVLVAHSYALMSHFRDKRKKLEEEERARQQRTLSFQPAQAAVARAPAVPARKAPAAPKTAKKTFKF